MNQSIKNILRLVVLIYVIHIINWILPYDLSQWGILPRTLWGLPGIAFAPLLHGSWVHLLSNTVPLVFLLFLLGTFYTKKTSEVIATIVLLGGLLVWIFGRSSIHIGASGLIYGLASFLIVHGVLQRNFKSLLLSILVVGLYGGLIWGVFPTHPWISWEGHLFGALAGGFSAYKLRNKQDKQDTVDVEQGV